MTRFVVPPGTSSSVTVPCPRARTVWIAAALFLFLLAFAVAEADAAPRRAADGTLCARYASPGGSDAWSGSASRPFRTAQRLANALRAGQTGCLMRGTYYGTVAIAADRIELASVARARARLRGNIWIRDSANRVTLSHLSIDGHDVVPITVQVHGDDALLRRLNITNRNKRNSTSTGSCLLLGHIGTPAFRTRVFRSRIHNCGGGNRGHDHGIYSEFSRRAVIRGNYIYDNPGFGISMYPDTQYALIEHNVINGNAYENREQRHLLRRGGRRRVRPRLRVVQQRSAQEHHQQRQGALQRRVVLSLLCSPRGTSSREIASGTRPSATSANAPATGCRSTSSRRRTSATGLPRTFAFVRSAGAAATARRLGRSGSARLVGRRRRPTGSVATVAAAVDDPRRAGCHELPRVASP